MARSTGSTRSQKKVKSRFARSAAGKAVNGFFGRLFCKRSIIIIADHKTQHVPFSTRTQPLGMVCVSAFVVWASYSSGSYMAAQQVLEEKERKLASSTMENRRVAAEFTLLKSDLMKLANATKTGKSGEYAKQLAEQYSKTSVLNGPTVGDDEDSQYDAVFKRVELLDNKVKELQATHDEMIADIRTATGGKIRELETVIARTGIAAQPVEKALAAKRVQEEQRREKYSRTENLGGGQGGPFQPARSSALKSQETELYYNVQRMMLLHEIVDTLPLAKPLKTSYRQTSSFGGRSDPFRRTAAFHSGVDLVGPDNAKVYATTDGKVEFAGWKSAYGNMVDIKHQHGLSTRYAHLDRVLVQPEQHVKKGQVIGIQGSTGRSTGHHLHYEVRYNGTPLNPNNFLKAGADVRAID